MPKPEVEFRIWDHVSVDSVHVYNRGKFGVAATHASRDIAKTKFPISA